ncbi:hypothetical protein KFK09_029068 [Dendrobium nobile]|uniref:Uncharacterized protein n=1 Tax=Dendrobium nobile TaxID=94219 RepID=A0A8T3A4G3_DENNO|nr:hypothetical protein KFK09_029068 [Dendrobium nobile]
MVPMIMVEKKDGYLCSQRASIISSDPTMCVEEELETRFLAWVAIVGDGREVQFGWLPIFKEADIRLDYKGNFSLLMEAGEVRKWARSREEVEAGKEYRGTDNVAIGDGRMLPISQTGRGIFPVAVDLII